MTPVGGIIIAGGTSAMEILVMRSISALKRATALYHSQSVITHHSLPELNHPYTSTRCTYSTAHSTFNSTSETMAKDMTLLWGSGSPACWRIMIALEEKNLQGYNEKQLHFAKGEHKSQEVLETNPRCQLPTFRHGNNILNESYAACMYLESQFRSQGNQLIPDNAAEQALMYQRMFEGTTLNEIYSNVIYYNYKVPEAERHDSAMKRNKETLAKELKLWEGYLGKLGAGSYLAGKTFSLADVTVFPSVAYVFRFGLPAEHYPKLAEYHTMLKDRASIKTSWPPHWLENPECQDLLKDL